MITKQELHAAHQEFILQFLRSRGIEHEERDASVGVNYDCWYVDSDTLAEMLTAYLTKISVK